MRFNDIAGKHHVRIGHMDHGVASGMGAAQLANINAAVAQKH